MIHLTKGDEPEVLVENADDWTETLVSKLQAGEAPTDSEKTRYRRPEIKLALVRETAGKCAYCESKLLHVHHGDVEHIYPKSLDPNLTFHWRNLTLACEICNQNKSNKDPYFEHLIDPYEVDPVDHITFLGPMIASRGTNLGTNTIVLLDLYRSELTEHRGRQISKILSVFSTIHNEGLPLATRRAIYQDLLNVEASSTAEYAAMNRVVIVGLSENLPPDITN